MAPTPAPRELILVVEPAAGLLVTEEGLSSGLFTPLHSFSEVLSGGGASLQPLFGLSKGLVEHRVSLLPESWSSTSPYLSLYYKVTAPDSRLEIIAEQLRGNSAVQTAFIKPGVELPLVDAGLILPPGPDPPQVTTDLTGQQLYLRQAPGGLDALSAWNMAGGTGAGINIIDIEGAWRFTHEDLTENQGGVAGGIQVPGLIWRDHGTAVLGILGADTNGFGIAGICPGARVRGVSVFGQPYGNFPAESGTAAAIRQAADLLHPGDIIVIEMQAPGPPDFRIRDDQRDYVPVEWWPDNMAAIQYATARGVIVVEAAGNGRRDLDDPIYDHNPIPPYGSFPASWSNPFRREQIDTGAILVGAGAPPLGTNGSDWGRDRSRLVYSNFGSSVDAQGWGYEVTTCAYGDVQRGPDEDRWYTKVFRGTSSATPMVAGALACVQGALRKADKPSLTPAQAREILRTTGSPQQNGPNGPISQRIGNRPIITEMIAKALQL